MTILAMVNAEKEGQIESKMMKARQLEEIREAKRKEAEARQAQKKSKLVRIHAYKFPAVLLKGFLDLRVANWFGPNRRKQSSPSAKNASTRVAPARQRMKRPARSRLQSQKERRRVLRLLEILCTKVILSIPGLCS